MKPIHRRSFLKAAFAGAASLPLAALLAPRATNAATGNDYRALVCVLLEGGADSFNLLVPTASGAHAAYRRLRGEMALARQELLTLSGSAHGFHPRLHRLHRRYERGEVAVVANVGTLKRPLSRADVLAGNDLPANLFSHNSQRDMWMTADARDAQRSGWAGRLADALDGGPFFNISVTSRDLMQRGRREALTIASDIQPFDDFYRLRDGDTDLGLPYREMILAARQHSNALVRALAEMRQSELELYQAAGGMLDGIETHLEFPTGVHETGRPLGSQLAQVARLLQARQIPGRVPGDPARQIFFVNYHGWDTHNTPLDRDSHLVDYLDESLDTFHREIEILGIQNQVTTFTISDFGRSLTPNGAGTDHGWGGHAWVVGGAVAGGIHGRPPVLEIDSPDAIDDRVIPEIAVEQYLAPLAAWLGADAADIATVFPNLTRFPNPLPQLLALNT